MQEFQVGHMYHKTGTSFASEVHGAILTHFLATGGLNAWGYPVTDELVLQSDSADVGRCSTFERATFYWSRSTGAHEVHGAIRTKYEELGAHLSTLGFPTSDEAKIPGVGGTTGYNTFSNGSLLDFDGRVLVCEPFQIKVGRVHAKDTDTDLASHRNDTDIFFFARVRKNGHQIRNQRFPSTGSHNSDTSFTVNTLLKDLFVPNSPDLKLEVEFEVWDADKFFNGKNDHLGKSTTVLNIANGWGLRNNPGGLMNTGEFKDVHNIAWAVVAQSDPNAALDFWNAGNSGTYSLTWSQYATTFRDVDPQREQCDPSDWFEQMFYDTVYEGIARGGNCYGVSLEAIYAWKGQSVLTRPLSKFEAWAVVRPHFNRKHAYQVGSEAIWWVVSEFLSGKTHEPMDVFKKSRAAFNAGEHPVLCISQNYDFSGASHCVVPYEWNDSKKPWTIKIFDPNFNNEPQTMSIDPIKNEYTYSAGTTYSGGDRRGGRMYYVPFSILSRRPSTPFEDALRLLVGGTIVLVGSEAETTYLRDLNGNELLGTNVKTGNVSDLQNTFVPFKGTIGTNALAGEMFLRASRSREVPSVTYDPAPAARVGDRVTGVLPRQTLGRVAAATTASGNLRVASGPALERLATDPTASDPLENVHNTHGFVHGLRSKGGGKITCGIAEKLSDLTLKFDVKAGNAAELRCERTDAGATTLHASGVTSKTMSLMVRSRHGVNGDVVKLTFDDIPVLSTEAVSLRVQPGMGGIDISGAVTKGTAVVKVSGTRAGVPFEGRWNVEIQGGSRLTLSEAGASQVLKVGRIDQLAGPLQRRS